MTISQKRKSTTIISNVKNDNESQQTQKGDVNNIEDKNDISKKLIDEAKTNSFITSEEQRQQQELSFKCFHCNQYFASDKHRVEHISLDHPGRMYYPTPKDFENRLTK
jgi:hypothetical protein